MKSNAAQSAKILGRKCGFTRAKNYGPRAWKALAILVVAACAAIHGQSSPKQMADPAVEAVHICTPNSLHFQMAKDALLAGKNVLCEKPLVGSLAQVERLMRAAAAHLAGAQREKEQAVAIVIGRVSSRPFRPWKGRAIQP